MFAIKKRAGSAEKDSLEKVRAPLNRAFMRLWLVYVLRVFAR